MALDGERRASQYAAPLQMILGVFASPDRAGNVRMTLRESERRRLIGIVGLALIKRDREGRLELLEARKASEWIEDRSGPYPAILRLIWGHSGQVPTSSSLVGIADVMPPGSSAIAALIEHRWLQDVCALMEEAGEGTVGEAVRAEIVAALEEGRDLVLTAGAADWRAGPLPRLGLAAVGEPRDAI